MRYHAGTGLREANVNGVRALIVAGALCGLAIAARAEDSPGVVVERLTPGAAGETAGLRAGDRLAGWKVAPGDGPDNSYDNKDSHAEIIGRLRSIDSGK